MHTEQQAIPISVDADEVECQVETWLTVPAQRRSSTLFVLVSGSTYSHLYWDWPTDPRYSYVRWMAESGHATLNFDRLGLGMSSHPPAKEVTVRAQAAVVHQLVSLARSGGLGGESFSRVVLVGHSLGSLISGTSAAIYGDVDAVIETGTSGFAAAAQDGDARVAEGWMWPATSDPKFADSDRGDGYFTTPPGMRERIFFHMPGVEDAVVSDDERLKETMTSGEISELGSMAELLAEVRVPVLCTTGEYDRIVSALGGDLPVWRVFELAADSAPGANFSFSVLPKMGHNLTQHRKAPAAYATMTNWLREVGMVE